MDLGSSSNLVPSNERTLLFRGAIT